MIKKGNKRFEVVMPIEEYKALCTFAEELKMSKSKFICIAVGHQMDAIIQSVEENKKEKK